MRAPIARAESGETNPAPGVIPTRPTTAPVAAPTAVACPPKRLSSASHVSAAAAAPAFVVTKASDAVPLAASAEPALNPNQPNHRSPAPRRTYGTLCGMRATRLKSWRGPSIFAATSAAVPAVTWTTVPPAKSSAPHALRNPPVPQTQCATGA